MRPKPPRTIPPMPISGPCRRSVGTRRTAPSRPQGRRRSPCSTPAWMRSTTSTLVGGYSAIGGDTSDGNGHGTWVASIAAANVDNGVGIAGVGYAGVSVMPVKVLAPTAPARTATSSTASSGQPTTAPTSSSWRSPTPATRRAAGRGRLRMGQRRRPRRGRRQRRLGDPDLSRPATPRSSASAATDSTDDALVGFQLRSMPCSSPRPASTSPPTVRQARPVSPARRPRPPSSPAPPPCLQANDPGRLERRDRRTPGPQRRRANGGAGNGRLNLARALADTRPKASRPRARPAAAGRSSAHTSWPPTTTPTSRPDGRRPTRPSTFSTLYRKTDRRHRPARPDHLPVGYTNISVAATAFSSGTWSTPVVNQVDPDGRRSAHGRHRPGDEQRRLGAHRRDGDDARCQPERQRRRVG